MLGRTPPIPKINNIITPKSKKRSSKRHSKKAKSFNNLNAYSSFKTELDKIVQNVGGMANFDNF
eukprot:UN29259